MSAIDEVKARYRAEKSTVMTAIKGIIGARVTLAVLALFVIGFSSKLLYAPTRLPPIGGLSLSQVGLQAPNFGEAGRLAGEAKAAAERENIAGEVNTFLGENREIVPVLNGIGLGACLILLIWNMWINARERRYRSQAALDRDAAARA